MSKRISALLIAVIAIAFNIVLASPSEAITCNISRSKTSTQTQVVNGNCYRVRARIDRYSGGIVYAVYGSASASVSTASSSDGVSAGHYSNKSLMGSSEIWDGWSSF